MNRRIFVKSTLSTSAISLGGCLGGSRVGDFEESKRSEAASEKGNGNSMKVVSNELNSDVTATLEGFSTGSLNGEPAVVAFVSIVNEDDVPHTISLETDFFNGNTFLGTNSAEEVVTLDQRLLPSVQKSWQEVLTEPKTEVSRIEVSIREARANPNK